MIKLTLVGTKGPDLQGFRYMWLKHVWGFNPLTHCAQCLVGQYLKCVGPNMDANDPQSLPGIPEGQFYYLCGVSAPYQWQNNFHLVFTQGQDTIEAPLWTGARFVLEGAKRIPFDDQAAKTLFPERTKAYLTCRNFQFGAGMFTGLDLQSQAQGAESQAQEAPQIKLL